MAVCSWGSERSRFVVFAILGLRCTDCSTAVFFSRLKTSSTRTVTSRFFLVGHGTGTQFRVLPRRGRRSRDPTLFLRDFQDGCIDKLKIDFWKSFLTPRIWEVRALLVPRWQTVLLVGLWASCKRVLGTSGSSSGHTEPIGSPTAHWRVPWKFNKLLKHKKSLLHYL